MTGMDNLPSFTRLSKDTKAPDLLDGSGRLRLLPAADYDLMDRNGVRLFCHQQARYGLPTRELVDWLGDLIRGRKAIEIGSGAGDLAHHLGIPATDSKIQEDPDVAAFYRATGQPVIRYPEWVEKLEAQEAIERHRPEVVVASWVTHWVHPDDFPAHNHGSSFGVREDLILDRGITYVVVGNHAIHRHKPIMARGHRSLPLPFLRSRGSLPELDRVYIWGS